MNAPPEKTGGSRGSLDADPKTPSTTTPAKASPNSTGPHEIDCAVAGQRPSRGLNDCR